MRTLRLQHRKRKDVPWLTASATKKPAPGLGRRGANGAPFVGGNNRKGRFTGTPTKRLDGCHNSRTDPKPHLRRQVVFYGSLARDVQKSWLPGGGDVVDPCRACDRRNSGAGPVPGKKIPALSRVGYRTMRGAARTSLRNCSRKGKKSPDPNSSGARQTGTFGLGVVTTRRLRDNTPRDHDVNFRLEKGRPKPPSLPSHERGEVG